MESKNRTFQIFTNTVNALKEFPKYKHLLLSIGLEDDINYDMNDDTSFELDSNISEFTSDAMRLSIIYYLYNYSNLEFDTTLLELEHNAFTFSYGNFNDKFLKILKAHIEENKIFIFPFLPIAGSSHWYTLFIIPANSQIYLINPLNQTDEKELTYLSKVINILCKKINIMYKTSVEHAGIQTSGKSCGESTLLIFLSLLINSVEGYKNLIKHLHKDLPINSIFELNTIVFGNFCECNICIDGNTPFVSIQLHYIYCKECHKLNVNNNETCNYCKISFNELHPITRGFFNLA